jgi:alpha/beta superfamily hydrolase
MDTRDFESCVELQGRTLAEFRPDVLVGSSFGGAVAVELLHRGSWRGPTLLLAQAALRLGSRSTLPDGVRVWLVHGTDDDVVDIEDSRLLARTGSPDLVRLIEVVDNHPLDQVVQSGKLLALVRDLFATSRRT